LPFNQDACFTKCIVQLLLINTVADTVDKFYDQLSLHVILFHNINHIYRTCISYLNVLIDHINLLKSSTKN